MLDPFLRRRSSRRQWLLAGCAASAGLLAGRWAWGSPSSPTRLRVLCYNIHHGEGTDGTVDLPRLAGVIKRARPDLVALQEVDRQTRRTGRVDQTAELARLTGLHGRFGRQIDYEGGQYGQAILSRFPIGKLAIHVLPGTPARETRIAVAAPIEVEGRALTFVTTHLHHASEAFRVQQAEELNELFASSKTPVILAGDLNATPDSRPLATLSHAWQPIAADRPLPTFPSSTALKQIDYILVRPRQQFRTITVEVVDERVASDHRPLLAEIEWR